MLSAQYRSIDKRKITIDDRELSARLGKICSHTDPDLFPIVDTVIREADPKYAVVSCPVTVSGGEVTLGFGRVKSVALAKCLFGCDEACVFAVTLGIGIDRLVSRISKTSRAEAFIYDAVASALAEAVCDVAEAEILDGRSASMRFSVGYGDFSLDHQAAVLDYLGAPTYLGISLTESGLMAPLKTITAVIGIK